MEKGVNRGTVTVGRELDGTGSAFRGVWGVAMIQCGCWQVVSEHLGQRQWPRDIWPPSQATLQKPGSAPLSSPH